VQKVVCLLTVEARCRQADIQTDRKATQ